MIPSKTELELIDRYTIFCKRFPVAFLNLGKELRKIDGVQLQSMPMGLWRLRDANRSLRTIEDSRAVRTARIVIMTKETSR